LHAKRRPVLAVLTGSARLLIAAGLALAGHVALAQAPSPGFLLVAKPSILDPNFARTVVLATHAPDGATLGVILNRPTKQSLAGILPGNERLARFTEPLHFGGPVEPVGLFAVFRGATSPGQSFPVTENVYLALHPATVEQLLLKPPEALRLFVGYSGWAPGQLDGERARGDWWTLEVDADTIFRKNTETLWDELSRRAGSVKALRDHDAKSAGKLEDNESGPPRSFAGLAPRR
jgi:putative transcriptional regulator